MIKGHCTTNLDEYRTEHWPKVFAGIPDKGDYVESASGKLLHVVQITHTTRPDEYDEYDEVSGMTLQKKEVIPYIIVELHRRLGG